MMHECKPFIPEDVSKEVIKRAMQESLMTRLARSRLAWIPYRRRPWYRRAWYTVNRYLPRVRVYLGPRDASCSCEDW